MVIHTWYDQATILDILNKSNGVLLQGGGRDFDLTQQWEKNALFILQTIQGMNDKGIYYPLWGTCQGFELLNTLVANNLAVLTNFNSYNIKNPLQGDATKLATYRMFSKFSPNDIYNLFNKDTTAEFHHLGVSEDTYNKFPELTDYFIPTTYGKDLDGKIYIASMEAKKYPVYSVQYHPEKVNFDTSPANAIPQSLDAISISQKLAEFFVDETRKNTQEFKDEDRSKYDFINTFAQGSWIKIDPAFYYIFQDPNSKNHPIKFLQ